LGNRKAKSAKVSKVTVSPAMPPAVWASSASRRRARPVGSTKYEMNAKVRKTEPGSSVRQKKGARCQSAGRPVRFWEALHEPPLPPRFHCHGRFAEDHLRAKITAVDAAEKDRRDHDQKHQEHQGEEDDAEFVDPELGAEEIEALAGDVETDNVEEWQSEEDEEASQVDALAKAVPETSGHEAPGFELLV